MVGISLALMLAAQSHRWRVLLVEANPQQQTSGDFPPSFDARSTALSFSTREILEDLQLWSSLQPHLEPINEIEVSDRGHFASTRMTATEQGYDAFGYVVENRQLGAVLGAALAAAEQRGAIEVAAPATVEALQVVQGGVELTLSDRTEPVTTELLVVADGANSKTCRKLGIGSESKPYGQYGLIANIALQQTHNGVAYERFTEQGPMALLPLNDSDGTKRSALVWTLDPQQAEHLRDCPEAEFIDQLQQRFGWRQGLFAGVGERHLYPLTLTTASEQVRRHVVVVGNAAHTLHPVAGQGFNLALRDLAALAAAIDGAGSNGLSPGELSVLQNYEGDQQQDQQRTIAASDWLPRLFGASAPLLAALRGSGLLLMDMVPPLREQFARYGMGLETPQRRVGVASAVESDDQRQPSNEDVR